jgi:probable rRNA maturation factor
VNRVEVNITYPHPPEPKEFIRDTALRVLHILKKERWELSVLLADDETLRRLNTEYRGIPGPTDVLSFSQVEGEQPPLPGEDPYTAAGDIVISFDTLQENSRRRGIPPREELVRLLVHGILHLTGLDHNEEDPHDAMLELQEEIMQKLRKEKAY